jgi:hypothetical protein
MKSLLPIALAIAVVFGAGCAPLKPSGPSPTSNSTPKVAPQEFDVKAAFYKSPKNVDAMFGKPTGSNKIKADDPTRTPGEFREYSWGPQKKHVLVRFYKGKCVMIQLELLESFDDPVNAVKSVGVDPSSVTPMTEAPMATRWKAKLGSFIFKDVAAIKSTSPEGKFDMVQFELADPD